MGRSFILAMVVMFLAISTGPCPAADSGTPAPRIHRKPVLSTALAAAGYNRRHRMLEIEFCNGAVYRYLEVPSVTYRKLLSAKSKARYYDSNIKGKYRSLRLRAAESRMVRFSNEAQLRTPASHSSAASE